MKQGRSSLMELAQVLEEEQARKLDFVVDTRTTEFSLNQDGPVLNVEDVGDLVVSPYAARQMCSRLKVPARLYDVLEEGTQRERGALAEVFNARMHDHPESRMIRAMNPPVEGAGQVRAYLSDRYRRMDSLDLLLHVLPVLSDVGNMQVASCEVTERRMFLKVSFPDIVAEPVVGDVVRAAICISNSEIGHGSLRVEPMVERLICANGMVVGTALRKFHVGRQQDPGFLDVLTDETLEADDQALWLKVRDVVRAALDQTAFNDTVAMLTDATTRRVDNVPAAVEVLAQRFKLSDVERDGVLSELIAGDPLLDRHGLRNTQYGLSQAITAFSQRDEVDYARASEMESFGGQLVQLKPSEWRRIAHAA